MSTRNALAFAAGLGGGYLKGKERAQDMERQAQEDAWKQEERDQIRASRAENEQMRRSLAGAIRPAEVTEGAGGMLRPETMDNRDVGLAENQSQPNAGLASARYRVGGNTYADRAAADKAVTEYNSTPAVYDRLSVAAAPFDPAKSMTLRDAASKARTDIQKEEDERRERAKVLKTENIGETYKAMLAENPQAVFETFNASGTKLKAPPQIVERRKVKTPFGEIDDAVWEGVVLGADGSETPIRRSTHQIGVQLYDVKDLLKNQSTVQEIGLKHANAKEIEKIKAGRESNAPSGYRRTDDGNLSYIPGGPADPANKREGPSTMERILIDGRRKDYASEEANAKKEAARLREALESGSLRTIYRSGNTKHEKWPEVQKALNAIAEAEAQAKESGARKAEYDRALDKLTGEVQGRRQPGLADVRPPQGAAPAASQAPASAAVNRSLRSTTAEMDVPSILGTELKRAMAAAQNNPRAASDVDSLRREIARLPRSQQEHAFGVAGAQAPAPMGLSSVVPKAPASGQPVKITTKNEHAALPKGTRYTAPDGSVRIKQ